MALEPRNGGDYYYRKTRVGGRVLSEYVGSGELALFASLMDEKEREDRRRRKEADRRSIDEAERIDRQLASAADLTRASLIKALEGAGFHRHRGQWRKRRHGRRSTPKPDPRHS